MSNLSVCQQYVERARAAVDEWDGVSTAELILAILHKTEEPVPEVLQIVKWKSEQAGRAPAQTSEVNECPKQPAKRRGSP